MSDQPTITLSTPVGDIFVLFNNDRSAYVRAGENEPTKADLTLKRGASVRVSSHYKLVDGGWKPLRRFTHVSRTDSSADTTANMDEQVDTAIVDALNEFSHFTDDGPVILKAAADAERKRDIAKRQETAKELYAAIEHIQAEVNALEHGGREQWFEGRLRSGLSTKTLHVVTVDGTVMDAPSDLPRISGSSSYASSILDLKETD